MCSGDGCEVQPILYCDCQGVRSYLCSNHQISHMMIECIHNFNPLVNVLTASRLTVVQSQIVDALKYLDSLQTAVLKSAQTLIQTICASSQKLLEQVRSQQEKYLSILTQVSKSKYIDKDEYRQILQLDKSFNYRHFAYIESFTNDINNLFDIEIFPNRGSIFEFSKSTSKELFQEDEISPKIQQVPEPHPLEEVKEIPKYDSSDDSEYVFFSSTTHKRSDLVRIDLNTFKLTPLSFHPPRRFSAYSQACKIQKDLYFYYDSYQGRSNAEIFVVNFEYNSYEKISDHSERRRGACVMKNNSVYVFGGCYVTKILGFISGETALMQNSDRFDLSTQTWRPIATLPSPSDSNTASLLNNEIYIVGGFLNFLLHYDTNTDTYREVFELAHKPQYKAICGKWILVESDDRIFEIKGNEEVCRYNMSNKLFRGSLLISCTFKKGKYIYLVLFNETLLRIDTEQKKLEEVKYS